MGADLQAEMCNTQVGLLLGGRTRGLVWQCWALGEPKDQGGCNLWFTPGRF